jgi:hypothetical protein
MFTREKDIAWIQNFHKNVAAAFKSRRFSLSFLGEIEKMYLFLPLQALNSKAY